MRHQSQQREHTHGGEAAGPAPHRVAVVFNPVSGRDPAEQRERDIRKAIADAGLELEWLPTTKEDTGRGVTKKAVELGVDLLLVSGGDGTVRECVSGLAGTTIPFAVLPGGTGNLLAQNLDIPDDLAGAMEVALTGVRRRIDVARTGEEHFAIMGGMGFDGAMFRDVNPKLKRRTGPLAYVVSGLENIRRARYSFTLTLDDQPPELRMANSVLIGNFGALQGGIPVLPDAEPDDGLLDVAIMNARNLRDWVAVATRLALHRPRNDRRVERFKAARVELRCDSEQPVELDGDSLDRTAHLVVTVQPAALTVCVPAEAGGGSR